VAFAGAVSSGSSSFVLDTADGLIQAFAVANSTLESSVGVSVWSVGINQRASYRWVAAPGSEIVYPAASSAGVALRALSAAYTGTVTGTVLFKNSKLSNAKRGRICCYLGPLGIQKECSTFSCAIATAWCISNQNAT